jgi:hypothetical protein
MAIPLMPEGMPLAEVVKKPPEVKVTGEPVALSNPNVMVPREFTLVVVADNINRTLSAGGAPDGPPNKGVGVPLPTVFGPGGRLGSWKVALGEGPVVAPENSALTSATESRVIVGSAANAAVVPRISPVRIIEALKQLNKLFFILRSLLFRRFGDGNTRRFPVLKNLIATCAKQIYRVLYWHSKNEPL